MRIKGLSIEQIKTCADKAGWFRLDNVRRKGNFIAFVLRMAEPTPKKCGVHWDPEGHDGFGYRCTRPFNHNGDHIARGTEKQVIDRWPNHKGIDTNEHKMRYRKLGMDMKRWTGAVCFHGHKAFMDEVFKLNPEALIVTTMARYEGKEDFDRKWVGTGMRPHGMAYLGMQYREFCDCYGG